jgi:hypothetical protein
MVSQQKKAITERERQSDKKKKKYLQQRYLLPE